MPTPRRELVASVIRSDDASLDELALRFTPAAIASVHAFFAYVRSGELSDLPTKSLDRAVANLEAIARRQQESTLYAFHVTDEYAEGDAEGVELYERIGQQLQPVVQWFQRDSVTQVAHCLEYLRRKERPLVYTGPISESFLNLPAVGDRDDWLERSCLTPEDVDDFERKGITVVSLERLL